MAEFEEIEEIFGETEEGLESEEMEAEEEAEIAEIKEAKANVKELSEDANTFKDMANKYSTKAYVKKFAIFAAKNAAIAAILFGVNLGLEKLYKKITGDSDEKQRAKERLDKVNCILKLIKTETDDCTKLKDWMQKHTDDTITLDGIEVPLGSILFKFTGPLSDVSVISQYITFNLRF